LLEKRSAAQGLPFLEVGELYVGNEIWCYSCGRDSHWGDVSVLPPFLHSVDQPILSLRTVQHAGLRSSTKTRPYFPNPQHFPVLSQKIAGILSRKGVDGKEDGKSR